VHSFQNRHVLIGISVLLALAILFGTVTTAELPKKDEPAPKPAVNTTLVTGQTLGGDERYLTHVSTDKPLYKHGETIRVRGVILHHATHKPLPEKANLPALIEVIGPKGDSVASGFVTSEDSVLGFSWQIPKEMAGGQYTAKVNYPGPGHPPAERKFDIRAYRSPRLKSQIKFLRDGYGLGDQVDVTLNVKRAEGGAPAGAKVTVIARVDGDEVFRGNSKVDDEGNCSARFKLPAEIRRGEGNLSMVIEDGGIVETASKTIPILLQTVDLTMYPEGGEIVGGLLNRVYFEAFTPAKKPADLAGVVFDSKGNKVAKFNSAHEGRGRFEFKPKAGEKYELAITEPSGIKTRYPLPEVKRSGVVIQSELFTYAAGKPLVLKVGASGAVKPAVVTISKREKIVASAAAPPRKDATMLAVSLDVPQDADGVLVATVWDAAGKPLAERLLFRQSAGGVNIKITPDVPRYVPGQKAKLTVKTTDAKGNPISAIVGLTVTDDSVLEMIEKRDQAPQLPVMVLLENDVKELADAHVYLDPNNEEAPQAVDLLLGTQGWRRFALVNPSKLMEEHGDLGRRAVALRIVPIHEREEVFKALRGARAEVKQKAGAIDAFGVDPQAAPVARPNEDAPRPFKKPQQAAQRPGQGQGDRNGRPVDAPQAEPEPAERPAAVAAPPIVLPEDGEPAASNSRQPLSKGRRALSDALKKADEKQNKRAFLRQKDRLQQIRNDFVAVRVYAHQIRSNRQPGQRTDFTETLFWHAGLKTDAKTGTATVEFGLNDSVTSFRVLADAFGADGALGGGTKQIESVEPFYLEPKIPLAVTAGDRINLPIGFVNATPSNLDAAQVQVKAHEALDLINTIGPFDLASDARVRRLVEIAVAKHAGNAELTIAARAGAFGDSVTRSILVEPNGFPIEEGRGGLLAADGEAHHEIEIPKTLVDGSLKCRVAVYPTPLATMNDALARLIREPYGCFEQTSSTTYPLVMAQQYFMSHEGVDPSLIEKSAKILEKGYNRLIGFECKSGGFEWFGADPGHEALTAYGLMEFNDMAQVHPVDPAMIDRTRTWLVGTRDGKGGFTRNRRALHTWITEPECSNGYIAWALLETGPNDGLSDEVQWLRVAAERGHNTYAVALAANVLCLAGDLEGANHLLDKLSGKQEDDGSLSGATTSIVGSGGEALKIETTSLAVLAWLKNRRYAANVEKSIKYLAEVCKGGRFGSTQSTVLALKAIVAYDASRAVPKAPGTVQLMVDGSPVGKAIPFDPETHGAIELPDASEILTPGKHKISLRMADGSQMPYSVAVDYFSVKPDSSRDCKLHLAVELRNTQIDEGASTEANVVVINHTNEAVPTPVAIIGVPGGLEVRHDQLKELVKAEKIAAYEVRGREVILYWRSLKAEERVELPISLIAAIPGTYTGPASRAYLYYTDEHKQWTNGLQVQITAKAEN
jgi:hypothetical protein